MNLAWGRFSLNLAQRCHVMGVINVTPDSFSDGGDFISPAEAVHQGLALAAAGADILDVGGESTRPGAAEVGTCEEIDRVLPVIRALAEKTGLPVSIDTYKAETAAAALEAGASMVNDISAARFEPEILDVAARAKVPVILMHMKGKPRTMQENPEYGDLLGEIKTFLLDAAARAEAAGVDPDLIVLDPGIGFGKTFDHNLVLINRLEELVALGRPLLVGASRKAFLGRILNGAVPKDRDAATAAVTALCAYKGAHIVRVHNARLARETLDVVRAVLREHA